MEDKSGRFDHWADVRDRSSFKLLNQPMVREDNMGTQEQEEVEHLRIKLEEQKNIIRIIQAEGLIELEELCRQIQNQCAGAFVGQRIARAVAKKHGVSYLELIGDRRSSHVVRARHEAMYIIRHHTKLSMPAIGRIFGGRDHSTVLHGIRAHTKRVANGK